jgi:hypothetical protein
MTTVITFSEINDSTGFANGEKFTTQAQVRSYFTMSNMHEMFGPHCEVDESTLTDMADAVICEKWHCEFS